MSRYMRAGRPAIHGAMVAQPPHAKALHPQATSANRERTRMRRNEPCFCNSGKRFKHCHGKPDARSPSSADLLRQRQEAARHERQKQQGYGEPIRSFNQQDGNKVVIVGRALMMGKWASFTDFLLDYVAERLGRQWVADEMHRGPEGHPIGQWGSKLGRATGNALPPRGVITKAKINNAFRSLLSIAYSLYLVEHHYQQYDEPLFERMVKRLRVVEGFLATVSEINAAAAFLKAGFVLRYDDDLRAGQHAEFTATYPESARRFSVEVKTRTGPLNPALRSIDQIKLKNKLSQALKKDLPWSRVVFIDINLPDLTLQLSF
ncbi:hypothetical protein ACVWXO_008256 [Bradyrhizobium sp. LM2.7]